MYNPIYFCLTDCCALSQLIVPFEDYPVDTKDPITKKQIIEKVKEGVKDNDNTTFYTILTSEEKENPKHEEMLLSLGFEFKFTFRRRPMYGDAPLYFYLLDVDDLIIPEKPVKKSALSTKKIKK